MRDGHGDAGRAAEAQGARRAGVRRERLPADEHVSGVGEDPDARRLQRRAHHRRRSIWSSSATRSPAATSSSRRCSTARCATARCPRPCASTFSGTRVRLSSPARTERPPRPRWPAGCSCTAVWIPSILVGGIARNLGEDGSSYRLGKGRDFVIEGDEYDSAYFDKTAKFLKYLPDIAVINNVEFDHADIYADLDAVRLAFRRLVNLVPRSGLLLLGADSPDALALKKVAVSPRRDVRPGRVVRLARNRRHGVGGGAVVQRLAREARDSRRCRSRLFGVHNVRNALAAIAVAHARVDPGGDDRRRAAAVSGRQAAAGDLRRGRRRDGVRRLRAPPDRHCRDARGPARRQPAPAHLGHLRAALCLVEPARVSAGLRARVRTGRRSHHRAGVPHEPARRGAPVGAAAGGRSQRRGPARAEPPRPSTTSSTTIAKERKDGDLVVFMSNGGFGGIHQKTLQALGA